jgi:hypothetical protein
MFSQPLLVVLSQEIFMSVEVIFDSPNATMWYYPESQIIHHQFHIPLQGEPFRDFMMLGTRTMADKGAHKWLSDDRAILAVHKDESQWGMNHWFPETIKAGWKHWAIIQPKHTISQLNLEKVAKTYSAMGINAMFFSDVDEAMKWLESQ